MTTGFLTGECNMKQSKRFGMENKEIEDSCSRGYGDNP